MWGPILVGATILLAGFVLGCVEQPGLPDDCDASAVQRDVSLGSERLDPESIDVCKGQDVTIAIASEADGDLHIHGHDAEVAVEAGATATLTITASLAGQFLIELHSEDGSEVEVGLLTVHEP